jgi:hypothetical protein
MLLCSEKYDEYKRDLDTSSIKDKTISTTSSPSKFTESPIRLGHLFKDDAYLSSSCCKLIERNRETGDESESESDAEHNVQTNVDKTEQTPYFKLKLNQFKAISL